jgi:hypothetical protein
VQSSRPQENFPPSFCFQHSEDHPPSFSSNTSFRNLQFWSLTTTEHKVKSTIPLVRKSKKYFLLPEGVMRHNFIAVLAFNRKE